MIIIKSDEEIDLMRDIRQGDSDSYLKELEDFHQARYIYRRH